MIDPATFFATIIRVWDKSGPLLWAMGTACIVAFGALAIGARVDPATFGPSSQAFNVWLLPFGLSFLVLATFRTAYERTHPQVRLVPREQSFYWHLTKQPDGRTTVQIAGHFEIYNLRNAPLVLSNIKVVRPRITGEIINRDVSVKQQRGPYTGRYSLDERTKGDGSLHIFAIQDFSHKRGPMRLVVKISDQFGHWYKMVVRRVPDR